jgi:hypothetical protein
MTDMKTKAQAIWDTYIGGYSKALMTPVEQFDTSMDKDSRKIIASVLRCLIDECSEVRGTGKVDKKSQVVSVKTLMELATELEAL